MLTQAMQLFAEHRKDYVFYTAQEKYKFHRRLRSLAKKIDCSDQANAQAVLTIDVIATLCGISVLFANER